MSKKPRKRTSCGRRVFLDNTALSRLETRPSKLAEALVDEHADDSIFVPAAVYAEWLVGQTDTYQTSQVKKFIDELPATDEQIAVRAGQALQKLYGKKCNGCGLRFRPSLVDGLLAAHADASTDIIYTADVADLTKLCAALSSQAEVRFAE